MPATMKRKGSPSLAEDSDASKRRATSPEPASQTGKPTKETSAVNPTPSPSSSNPASDETTSAKAPSASDAMRARFAAAQARAAQSKKDNRKETQSEVRRATTDQSQLTALNRKRDVAQNKLLKAETEADGEDFERKRAWDWTIDESERWDERMAEKEANRKGVAFADYTQEANKVYERNLKLMNKGAGETERREAYEKSKRDAIEKSIKGGGLELVETEDGELIAVDRDGSFYSTADSTGFANSKPDKAAVDRLVGDIKKAEEIRLKKRKARGLEDDPDGDVTFINEKNKQFNQKLGRFYDKYTADIKKSFERGTAI